MSEGSCAKEISLGDSFGEVAVKANGIRIELHADGSVDAYTAGAVKVHPAANDTTTGKKTAREIPLRPVPQNGTDLKMHGFACGSFGGQVGDEMEDGTIYAGVSPDTGRPLYATPRDEPLTVTFKEAAIQAGALSMTKTRRCGHHDWRVPSKGELNVLWENRTKGKLAGTFDETGSYPAGWYWSSSPGYDGFGWAQRFSDGNLFEAYKNNASSLRCVR